MKLGAVTMAYNDEGIIRGTIRCLAPFVDRHVVMLSEKPLNGEYSPPDRTEEICEEEGVDIVKGFWQEHEQRNVGTILCKDCDWVICFDSDEMITKDDMVKLVGFLETTEHRAIGAHSRVYWSTTDYALDPSPDHKIIIAIKPDVRFIEKRNVNCPWMFLGQDFIIHHHLSWCAPKDIYKKVTNYSHADEFDGKNWHDLYFRHWKVGDKAIEPFGTEFNTVYNPLPKELLDLL